MNEFLLDKETSEKIEWDDFLSLIEVRSHLGLQYKNTLKPFLPGREKELKKELLRTQKFSQFILKHPDWLRLFSSNIQELKDLRNSLKKAQEGGRLTVTEIFEIKRLLFIIENIKVMMKSKELSWLASFRPKGAPLLFRILNKGNQSPQSFYIVDEYSSLLKRKRREKLKLYAKLEEEKEKISQELKRIGLKPSDLEEISLARDASQVSFMRSHPLFYLKSENTHTLVFAYRFSSDALEWKNKIKEIEIEEEREEGEVCKRLSQEISKFVKILIPDLEKLAYLDFLLAKSEASLRYQGVMPDILKKKGKTSLFMREGLHLPLALRLREKGYEFHPLSIRLKSGAALL
ncbi:MAG: hypothetical protein ACPL7L_04030, partial [bacterium]